jgi:hypothetical protein
MSSSKAVIPKTDVRPRTDLDPGLINEIYDTIEKNPAAIEPKKVLVQWFLAAGWMDSAKGIIKELRDLVPRDKQVKEWFSEYCLLQDDESEAAHGSSSKKEEKGLAKKMGYLELVPRPPQTNDEKLSFEASINDLEQGAKEFKIRSQRLLFFMQLRQKQNSSPKRAAEIETLRGLSEGKFGSTLKTLPGYKGTNVVTQVSGRPDSARTVAKKVNLSPKNAFDIIMADFDLFVKWTKSQPGARVDDDAVKALVLGRKTLIDNDLPDHLHVHSDMALMHLDREKFKRKYVNSETMYGDEIPDIKRENFLCTEDGYAWDMEELAAAIKANDGVMRNPLSKQMFTPSDVRKIINHKQGSALQALQVEQSQLRKGIRLQTLDQMTKLSKAFLADMEDEGIKSRQALDEFMAYMATLPETEQKALDCLKVAARDSHTGMAFDDTIGQAVRDAKANKLCFHKAGDFIGQAANTLRKS